MNTLNPTAAKPSSCNISLNPHRPSLHKPLSFRIPPPSLSNSSIKASIHNHKKPQNVFNFQNSCPNFQLIPFLAPIKATIVATVTAAALLFCGFSFHLKPSIAIAAALPTTSVETKDSILDDEREKILEERLVSDPDYVEGLKSLMEIKIKSKKLPEAIEILNKLAELEPEDIEWPMMRAHLYAYSGEFELAKSEFNELLAKDPFRVEAYHGLVTVVSQEESSEELGGIERRVEEAMRLCKKEKKESDLRDFKLLLAQIRVLEGRYDEALKVYQELVKEEPRDFRPYLCQGIIYTLLRKNNEAEKSFEKYRSLVPKEHPYASYFDDNMIATKIFAQKAENERAMAKS